MQQEFYVPRLGRVVSIHRVCELPLLQKFLHTSTQGLLVAMEFYEYEHIVAKFFCATTEFLFCRGFYF